jgi:hypothetical protein
MSKDLLKLFCLIVGFVALSPTTSMAQKPVFEHDSAHGAEIKPKRAADFTNPGALNIASSPSSLLAPPLYQMPCSAGGSLNSSTATSLRAVPSVFGAQSSFASC